MLIGPNILDRPTEEQSFRIVLAPALCIKVNNSGESHFVLFSTNNNNNNNKEDFSH